MEDSVKVFAVAAVVDVHVGVGAAGADGEAVESVVSFGPPAVEDGEVEASVEDDLLSAGARGFEGTAWVVEPDVDSLDEVAAYVDVVVLDEDELVGELAVAHHLGDLLEDLLARLVEGMGFAGEDELHWALGVVDHGRESLDVGKEEVGALVSGKAAGEADGEGIRGEELAEVLQGFAGFVAALGLFDGAAAYEFQKIGFEA